MKQNKQAFTLIELLVVVLIIGILAAVAMPQYQKAVEKSRAMQAIVIVKSIGDAQEIYRLANGEYASSLDMLDIEGPGDEYTAIQEDGNGQQRKRIGYFDYAPFCKAKANCIVSANRWDEVADGGAYYSLFRIGGSTKIYCVEYSPSIPTSLAGICKNLSGGETDSGYYVIH